MEKCGTTTTRRYLYMKHHDEDKQSQHFNNRQTPRSQPNSTNSKSFRTYTRNTKHVDWRCGKHKMENELCRAPTGTTTSRPSNMGEEQEQTLVYRSRHLTWSEVLRELIEEPKEHCFGKNCRQRVLQTWQPERLPVQLRLGAGMPQAQQRPAWAQGTTGPLAQACPASEHCIVQSVTVAGWEAKAMLHNFLYQRKEGES